MLLTLVRHACASRQNKFAVHVLQQDRSLACHVREDSLDALGEKEGKEVDDDAEKSTQAGLLSACFQLIFDESEHCRQIETGSSASSGFSLRALVAFTPVARLTLTKLFAIFLHKTDVFLR
jgi:hypothetical protein